MIMYVQMKEHNYRGCMYRFKLSGNSMHDAALHYKVHNQQSNITNVVVVEAEYYRSRGEYASHLCIPWGSRTLHVFTLDVIFISLLNNLFVNIL